MKRQAALLPEALPYFCGATDKRKNNGVLFTTPTVRTQAGRKIECFIPLPGSPINQYQPAPYPSHKKEPASGDKLP